MPRSKLGGALRRRVFLLAALLALATAGAQEPPLATARALRLLTPEEAALRRAVDVTGTVTLVDPARTIFFQDETGGTFTKIAPKRPEVRAGHRIRVRGVTYAGLYVPGIDPETIEVVGEGPLPAALPITFEQLAAGEFNYQRVELRGVVRSVAGNAERTVAILSSGAGRLEVHLPAEALDPALGLVDASVVARGLAAGFINDRRQLVTPHLRALGLEEITVAEAAADPAQLPLTSANHLLRFPAHGRAGHRAKVRGIVTHAAADRLFLRDEEVGLMVQARVAEPLPPGTLIEALGFPAMGRFSAFLEDATYQRTEGDFPAPSPKPSDLKTVLSGAHDADLISLEAEVREIVRAPEEITLLMRAGAVLFPARLPRAGVGELLPGLRTGSLLRLSGVCSVAQAASSPTGFTTKPVAFELLLRTPADVQILRPAPWWTARKLAIVALACVAAAALALAWAAMLRRQVRRQTRVISSKLHAEAVAEERQRIAREFHDTLEQELVALSLRLDTARAKLGDSPVRPLLESSRRLVDRLQSEGRDFIWDLREHTTTAEDLRRGIVEATASLCEETGTARAVTIDGEPRALRGAAAHALVRIAQEATANAIRHGRAKTVSIQVIIEPEQVRLRIEDDGAGFTPSDPPSSAPGHFGLQGMRERMQKLQGQLSIQSAPGKGTVIEAIAPA